MSMTMTDLIESIQRQSDCGVKPLGSLPNVGANELPSDVVEFYSLVGGATLFRDSPYGIEIVSPEDFVRANPVIVGNSCEDDITHDWYIVAKNGEQYITIDLAPARAGMCYDSFWDRHGVPGSCPVVARSFTDLLERLLAAKGSELYWLEPQFKNLGDAYELIT